MKLNDRPWTSLYDEGVPATIEIPRISLVKLFIQSVKTYGESVCTIFEGEALTYQEIDALSDRVARYFVAMGLKKGQRVGIMLLNTPAFIISYFGILKAGGVVMALNPNYRPAEVEKLVIESDVRILILSNSAYQEMMTLRSRTKIDTIVVVGSCNMLAKEDIFWEDLLKAYETGELVDVVVHPEDPAVFQYSGGTTGTPKCAVGLHQNLVANVYQFSYWLVNTEQGKEGVLIAIPLYHVYGMVLGMILAIKLGARMILIANPRDLDGLLDAAETYHASIFPGVPNIYAAINQYPPVLAGEYDLSSIKACISGSTTLPFRVKKAFETLTHGHLVEGYGLSEAPTATHCNPILGENREGSIGLPLPNVDCRVVDIETGRIDVAVGEIGELIIKGPQVMAGYHRRRRETDMVLRDDWLYTGDIVRMDRQGYFYIVDRKKDVIKVGGFQVWPNEIETVIMRHPKVREVAVAGVIDVDGTEVAKAWVVLQEGETSIADEIRSFCDPFLTHYKIPKYVAFRDSLPRTRVGKVLRRVLVSEHISSFGK
ncbi:MAG: long-chain fatty acid--CoA ligase [Chloroflexota bacterium]|nr:long-chain fatty acid--CoA ligase [Chloroflexota bacterium]